MTYYKSLYEFSDEEKEELRFLLENHPMVKRLRNNSSWAGAANAAIDYCIDGDECPVDSWRKSSTWQQVNYAFEKILKERRKK